MGGTLDEAGYGQEAQGPGGGRTARLANAEVAAACTPGVREVVRRLRDEGFDTTDSGDGVANVEAGMEGALPIPHVVMVIPTHEVVSGAERLLELVRSWGVPIGGASGALVESTYSPVDGVVLLTLFGVVDAMLPSP